MNAETASRNDELIAIVDEKLTALIREMEFADWRADEVAFAIEEVLRTKWLDQADALRRARESIPQNFLSDGNEG